MDTAPIPLFSRQRPYYIVAEDYSRTDSRTRVMHQLCHALNLIGAEAYVLAGSSSNALRAPILGAVIEQQHKEAGLQPIVVYPEHVRGNPLDASSVVRYAYRSRVVCADGECCFAADASLLADGAPTAHLLLPPLFDRSKYQPGKTRGETWLAYTGDYPDARHHFAGLLEQCEIIDQTHPATEDALIALLQRADRLYCFGESALAVQAALCGCPVVYVAAPGGAPCPASVFATAPDCYAGDDAPEVLEQVRAHLAGFAPIHAAFEAAFAQQLRDFVRITQALVVPPKGNMIHEEFLDSLFTRWIATRIAAPAIDAKRYQRWKANRSLQEIDAELMAIRMVREWPSRPCFHLLVEVRAGEESLLADTVDALDAQLYNDWRVTIVSSMASPAGAFGAAEKVRWHTVDDPQSVPAKLARCAVDGGSDWCALIQPGLRLEPFALQMLGDYLAIRPNWHFVYADEGIVDASGRISDPRFKPDLNLDLLRSVDYLGGFCPIRVSTLAAAGGLGSLIGAETYDSALRILDHHGVAAIGHIPEVLYHSPAATLRTLAVEAERAAVQAHLARWKVDAIVQDGHGYATRRVIYRHADTPKVSVVILSRDKAEYLGPCLDSLFRHTTYSAFEVIVLDAGNTEPDARALIDNLSANTTLPLRVLPCAPDAGLAVQYNAAAAAATGDYLLFVDDDTVILQDDWLERLIATASRAEVGMVGARTAAPGQDKIHDTGLVLGFRGAAETPYNKVLEADAPGYLGYRTLDQNVSAVSAACVMIRASLFNALGGFEAKRFPHDHTMLDLCLRVNESKYWVVWTPYVTLARYGNSSRTAPPKETEVRARQAVATEQESDALIRRWLPTLAKDPFYNRNLSLSEAYQPDHRATVDWDVNFHDRKRLIGFPLPGGSGEYRIIAPFRAISLAGLAQTSVVHSERKNMRVLSLVEIARAEPDVVVVHQAVEHLQIATLENYKKYCPGVRRVTGLDDLVSLLPPKHPSYRKRAVDIRPRLRASLKVCDRVVVSTEPLAELCRPLIDEVVIMPNCLEWDIWGGLEALYAPTPKPRVGWIGAQQHYGDLEHIFAVVEQLADEVDWVFMGMCPDPIRKYVKEYHHWASGFAAYSSKMASLNLDLAIAPLDVNPFNEAKSNLRLLEYGVMRWPVVCTDIFPYQNAPVTRVANTTAAWVGAIREKLSDRAAARREGEALRAWVEDNFILENHVQAWLDAFSGS